MFERVFGLKQRGTTIRRESLGGLVTFLALSYILFVQPVILSNSNMVEPMNAGGVFVATCLCSALACFLMGIWANLPVALAPAMGHNVFFALTVCGVASVGGMGWTWREALAANFIGGAIFVLLAATRLQTALIRAIPDSLKHAIAVGIGLLIAFVGLQMGGVVVANPAVYVQLGSLHSPVVLLTLLGVLVIGVLLTFNVRGAILYGVLITAIAGLAASHLWGDAWGYRLVEWKSQVPNPVEGAKATFFGVFHGFGQLFTENPAMRWLTIIFIFLILDLFDTVGTLVGVAERGGLMRDGQIPRARQALISDGLATMAGTVAGTSTITSYVESAAGISAGARTGLASVVTGLLLLGSLFLYPVVEMVGGTVLVPAASLNPAAAADAPVPCHPVVAPVLIIIGCYMLPMVRRIAWDDWTEALPAFLTIVVMQFALSISHGIAWGIISYVVLKVLRGRLRDVHPLLGVFALLFVVFLAAA